MQDVSITELINTPAIQLLVVMAFMSIFTNSIREIGNAVVFVSNTIRGKKANGNGSAHGVSDYMVSQQKTIDHMESVNNKLLDQLSAFRDFLTEYSQTRSMHELNSLKIEQTGARVDKLTTATDKLSDHVIRYTNNSTAREIEWHQFMARQAEASEKIVYLAERTNTLLEKLVENGNGHPPTEPHDKLPPAPQKPLDVDAAKGNVTPGDFEKKGDGSDTLPKTGTDD